MQTATLRQADEKYGNYKVLRVIDIPEIQSTLIELEHGPTGAQILHIANDDDENLFNLSFRTHPETSNGVAHILEHTVLCGSKKFPVRDPFFSMSRRSLNTFMNALTGPDFTCYPASSQVPKDFYNLLEVYLDAVFHPILSELSFLQEGHRLEFLNPEDPNSPLVFKGIVFNEMKGAMANPDSRLTEELMHALFPDLTYGINSGGNPQDVLSLTYEQLKEFHSKFYHPSRCLFYFYGNLPIQQHLDFLEKHAFVGVRRLPPLPLLPRQPRFQKPAFVKKTYPIHESDNLEEQTLVGMGWVTCSILNQEDLLALNILDLVLSGTDAAPLKMALLKSNLCKQADTILEGEMSEAPFIVVCKGCRENSSEALEEITRKTLEKIANEGLPHHLIEAVIHQIEMARTEITGSSSPYGLSLFWRSALLKQHGGLPEDGLKIHTLFNQIEKNVGDKNYFPNLIRKYFLNNNHFVRIEMNPDPNLESKELAVEKEKLHKVVQTLQDHEIQKILQQSQELAESQEDASESTLELLPKVSLQDVKREGKEFPLDKTAYDAFELFSHSCFTNGLVYADLIYDLPHFEEKDLPWLRLFSILLPQVGSGGRSYEQHLEYILEHTGGVGVALDLFLQAESSDKMDPAFILRGKALSRKCSKFFPLLKDIILTADFTDISRLKELLMQHLHGLENSIQQSALRFAVNLAASGFSIPSKITNIWYGLDYYWWLKETVKKFEQNPQSLVDNLQRIQSHCLPQQKPKLVIGCDENDLERLKNEAFYGLNQLTSKKLQPWKSDYAPAEKISQARIIASPVAFTTLLFESLSYADPNAAALSLASEIMENKTLHKKIREQGGAYGCGAVHSVLSGQFYFYSYRDPHLKATLNAFKTAVKELMAKKFNKKDLEEAQLGLFQEIDTPTAPGLKAMAAYSRLRGGRTPANRQRFRDALFDCNEKKIQQVAEEILLSGLENHVIVTFAGKEFLEKENALLKDQALPIYSI